MDNRKLIDLLKVMGENEINHSAPERLLKVWGTLELQVQWRYETRVIGLLNQIADHCPEQQLNFDCLSHPFQQIIIK